MSRLRVFPLLCLLAGLAAPVLATDEPANPLQQQLGRIQALRTERPGDGLLVYYEALTQVQLGDRAAALKALGALEGRRLGIVPTRGIGFDPIWSDPEFQALRQRLWEQEAATPAAPVALRLADTRLVPEGIAYDAAGRRVFLGSVAQHKIMAVDRRGRARDFSPKGAALDAVLGLAVDARRQRLCAVSTNAFEDSVKQQRRNAVVCFQLRTGRVLSRHDAPEANQLNDLAIAADGTVYATDSGGSSLFRIGPGEKAMSRVGAAGGLRGANGVAMAPDGRLYVALSTGVALVDTQTGEPMRLPQPDDTVTGGIDGLVWHEGGLVGVQNVSNPGRVIRIALDESGRRITGHTVLQSHHHPAFDEPTTGAVVGDALFVIANSQVGRYQADGTLKDADTLQAPVVMAVPLRR
jgi:sugar lactone lactonase YvrE